MRKFIILLLLLIPFVISEYTEVGNLVSNFTGDRGAFNTVLTTDTITGVKSNSGTYPPLIVDLDNDGVNEVIHASESNLRIYQYNTLSLITAYALSGDPAQGNMITFDIDNDNNSEIITASGGTIEILEFNGTDINQLRVKTISDLLPNYNDGEYMVKCLGTDNCVILAIEFDQNFPTGGGGGTIRMFAAQFGRDTNGSQFTAYNSGAGSYQLPCFPKIRTATVTDYDLDGDDEVIFTFMVGEMGGATQDYGVIYWMGVNSNGTVTKETLALDTTPNNIVSGDSTCNESNLGKYISPPSVGDLDNGVVGLETVFAISEDDDEFKIRMYDKNYNQIDTFPAAFDGTGTIMSGVMIGNVFDSTTTPDFCVLGIDSEKSSNQLDLVCASKTLGTPETREFTFDNDDYYNISESYLNYNILGHLGNMDSDTQHELISSLGIFDLRLVLPLFDQLDRIYDHGLGDSVVIPSDVESVGLADLLVLTTTNLYYIDDGFTNGGAEITDGFTNPCLNGGVLKLNNGSFQVSVEVTDNNGALITADNVGARAIFYADHPNEQAFNWSENLTSGSTFNFEFIINETVTNGVLKIQGRDTERPDLVDEIVKTFSVGAQGVEFGDCTSSIIDATEENESQTAAGIILTDSDNNAFNSAMVNLRSTTGLGATTLWIILMVIITYAVWVGTAQGNHHIAMGVVVMINILMFVIGSFMGFISTSIIITLVAVFMIIGGFWLKRLMTSNGGM